MEKLNEIKETEWSGRLRHSLVERWSEFVNCPKRLETEGPFLDKYLAKYDYPRVLDAAMGIGCETIYLTKKGVQVTGNEIAPELRDIALQHAKAQGIDIDVTSHYWQKLKSAFGANVFDIVLILGNSLCLLREYRKRVRVALAIREICKPGGTIIVDQRNFSYILDNRNEILGGNFCYSGKVVYCGKSVKGFPKSIEDDCVRFEYQDVNTKQNIGFLDMHPFRRGELISLFMEAGFKEVEIYSDFIPGHKDTADFFTYVFR